MYVNAQLRGLTHGNEMDEAMIDIILALRLYVRHNIDWTDAFVAAQVISQKARTIYSYDRDFDRIADIVRVEP